MRLRAQIKSLADQTDLVVGTARILVQSIDDSRLSDKDRYIVDTLRDRLEVLDVLEGDSA